MKVITQFLKRNNIHKRISKLILICLASWATHVHGQCPNMDCDIEIASGDCPNPAGHPCYDPPQRPNCDAKDVKILDVYLAKDAGGTCLTSQDCNNLDPDQNIDVYVCIVFCSNNNSDRQGIYVKGTVMGMISGTTIEIDHCFDLTLQQDVPEIACVPAPDFYSWDCSEALVLKNALTVWGNGSGAVCPTGGGDGGDLICASTNKAKCRCYGDIQISTPLRADFNFTQCINIGDPTGLVHFTALPMGGDTPYVYNWDFGDAAMTGNMDSLVSHNYQTPGPFTVTLTVTDDDNTSVMVEKEVSIETCCTLSVMCPMDGDLGDFDCSTIANIPDPPTDVATAEAAPYNIEIGDNPCGNIIVFSSDDGTVDICAANDNTITRTVTIFDDVGDGAGGPADGLLNVGELFDVCTFTFDVLVDEDPTIDCSGVQDLVLECDGDYINEIQDWIDAAITFIETNSDDDCDASLTGSDDWDGSSVPPLSCDLSNGLDVTFTVNDDCNNSDECTATIYIDDTEDPTIDCSGVQDLVLECDGDYINEIQDWIDAAITFIEANSDDDCDASLTGSDDWDGSSVPALSCDLSNGLDVTFTVTDDCNNSDECTATIYIDDTQDPTIDCSGVQDLVLECDGDYLNEIQNWIDAAITFIEANSDDDCDASLTGSDDWDGSSVPALSCNLSNGLDVTFTVTDDCNNSDECTATIYIDDTEDPTIDCSGVQDLVLECDGDYLNEIQNWIDAAITFIEANSDDDCDASLTGSDDWDGSSVPPLSCDLSNGLDVTFTVTDDCNNSDECTATIYIDDTQDPTIDCSGVQDLVLECDGDYLNEIQDWIDAAITFIETNSDDDCDASLTGSDDWDRSSVPPLSCDLSNGLDVTFTVTDDCNNSDECTATIYIDDTEDPTIDCSGVQDLVLECDGDYINEIQDWIDAAITFIETNSDDDCDALLTGSDDWDGSSVPPLSCDLSNGLDVTFTVTDDCNNSDECTATIYIDDTEDPTFPNCVGGSVGTIVDLGTTPPDEDDAIVAVGIPTDDCGLGTNEPSATGGPITGVCQLSQTWTVGISDQCGNEATCMVTFTWTSPPMICETPVIVNADCNGSQTGSATVIVSGGTPGVDPAPAYTYLWSNGQTTQTATGLGADNYTVTVTDAYGCEMICDIAVGEASSLVCNPADINDVGCFGASTGSATVNVTGGTGDYSYLWSDGQSSQTAIGLAADDYTVIVTDENDCEIVCDISISEPTALSCDDPDITDVTCNGESNGSATVNVSGGTGDYTYLWSDGQTNQTATGLAANDYTVTVTDENNCQIVCDISISEPTALSCDDPDITDVTCNGESNGSATVNVSGGTGDYTYLWSDGQTTQTATGLAANDYTVTVTDENDCEIVCNIAIEEPTALSCDDPDITDVTCNGESDGSATVHVSGGTGDYTYLWSNGQTTQTASGLAAGDYTVTVTDAADCEIVCDISIEEPTALECGTPDITDADCNASSTGSAGVNVSGGTPGVDPDPTYTYLWSDGQTAQTATGLTAGDYTVTVTDAAGCTIVCNATVSEASALFADILPTCVDGEALINLLTIASGGTGPYTFAWEGPDGFTSTDQNLSSVAQGTYDLTVTDANGCTFTTSATKEDCCDEGILFLPLIDPSEYCFNGPLPPTVNNVPPPIPMEELINDLQVTGNCVQMSELNVANTVTGPVVDGSTYTFTRTYNISAPNALPTQRNELIVILYDPVPPVLSGLPEDLTLHCGDELPSAEVVTAYDIVYEDVPVRFTEDLEGSICGYTVRRTYRATDGCDNTVTGVQRIRFIDDLAPELEVPADTTIYCPGTIPPAQYISASDNCSSFDLSFDESYDYADNDCEFTLTRTWTAVDECGNKTVKTQEIVFIDNIGPEITIVNPMLQGLEVGDEMVTYGCEDPRVTMGDVEIADECCNVATRDSGDILIASHKCDVFGYFRKWKCYWSATDEAGNTTEFYFYVLQYDTTAPVIHNVPGYSEVPCDSLVPAPDSTVYAEDDCALATTSIVTFTEDTIYDPADPARYALIRTWQAEDYCDNVSTAEQVIAVCGFDTALISSSIGNLVWEDINGNGLQDNLEPGINMVPVYLYDRAEGSADEWRLLDSTKTHTIRDEAGHFVFNRLHEGEYRVRFKMMDNLIFTQQNEGDNDELDSDVDPSTGMTDAITLTAFEDIIHIDAGMMVGELEPEPPSAGGSKGSPCPGEDCDRLVRIYISPNPFGDVVNLTYVAGENTAAKISVFDGLGRKVASMSTNASKGENREEVNLSTLPTGAYILRLQVGGQFANKMIIKGL